eukprot:PhF_6_TR40558/c0_g1_i1/m.60809/K15121/SLC25A44; solute carrier family 25, member 44
MTLTPSDDNNKHHSHHHLHHDTHHPEHNNEEVTALNRSWSDIDPVKWFSMTATWSLCYSICTHPMNLMSLKRQTCESNEIPQSYSQSIRTHISLHGVRGLYRGFFATYFGASVSEWIYLGVLENCKERLPIEKDWIRDGLSGFSADLTSQLFYIPFGLIGNRQMAAGHGISAYPYMSTPRYFRHIVQTEGIRGLYVGLMASLMLVPSSGVWWSIYGELKKYLYGHHHVLMGLYGSYASMLPRPFTSETDNVIHNSLAGGLAGLSITGLINPVWVVRARVQVMEDSEERTLRHVVKDIWRSHGVKGFYRGAGMNATIYAMESAIFGTLYEYFKYLAQIDEDA